MKIIDQNLSLSAQREFYQEQQQSIQQQRFTNQSDMSSRPSITVQEAVNSTRFNIGQKELAVNLSAPIDGTNNSESKLPAHLLKMIEVVEAVMERITGAPYKLKVYGYNTDADVQSAQKMSGLNAESRSINPIFGNFSTQGMRTTISEQFIESEKMRFSASGSVSTADGRQIDFALNTVQSRQFISQSQFTLESGAVPQDPLVVSFGGEPAQLSLQSFAVDIDLDGENEQLKMMQSGSGYLVLDKNADGVIDSGKELFGAQTGNGFSELAVYDQDQNGWIDENDPIFAQLQIYHLDENGMQRLDGLMTLDIGAISVSSVASEFSHKDENNQTQAQVRSSSVFLFESSGQAGLVQQVDVVV
ncbi:hypothetical protein J3998_04370 [Thiomicrorhabdus sp. 6S2-11]|uniref:VCBS repeat-containing protein n=1 Tax=Thiomicrorhabdus marina TaxID=2818442 RepID=A0ABS3Q395_9GAMM|nr:hypothetical protein [Thiomicrorhabdus marina]MBO1926802.1 hypothetical protein [Thiomicrorhabdus marina]